MKKQPRKTRVAIATPADKTPKPADKTPKPARPKPTEIKLEICKYLGNYETVRLAVEYDLGQCDMQRAFEIAKAELDEAVCRLYPVLYPALTAKPKPETDQDNTIKSKLTFKI